MLTALLSLYLGSWFCAPNGPDKLLAMPPEISFHPDWQIENGIFNRPIMVRPSPGTQVGARTRISALFHLWRRLTLVIVTMYLPILRRKTLKNHTLISGTITILDNLIMPSCSRHSITNRSIQGYTLLHSSRQPWPHTVEPRYREGGGGDCHVWAI